MASRKELKEAYRQMKFRAGISCLRNTVNQKVWLEGSLNIDALWNRYRMQLKFGMFPNEALQADWNHYGEAAFRFEIPAELEAGEMSEVEHRREIKLLEEMYLREWQPYDDKGYHPRPRIS